MQTNRNVADHLLTKNIMLPLHPVVKNTCRTSAKVPTHVVHVPTYHLTLKQGKSRKYILRQLSFNNNFSLVVDTLSMNR